MMDPLHMPVWRGARPALLATIVAAVLLLAALIALVVGLLVTTARACDTTIPEQRWNALCVDHWVGRRVRATLIVTVRSHTTEPDLAPGWGPIQTASVSVVPRRGPAFVAHYIRNTGADPTMWLWNLLTPPCLTPQCMTDRMTAGYIGVTRDDLRDAERVLNKLLWQTPDAEMAAQLRTAYGIAESDAVATIIRVWDRRAAITETPSATTFAVPVRFQWAVPRAGC
jgi:hypothetical protein